MEFDALRAEHSRVQLQLAECAIELQHMARLRSEAAQGQTHNKTRAEEAEQHAHELTKRIQQVTTAGETGCWRKGDQEICHVRLFVCSMK